MKTNASTDNTKRAKVEIGGAMRCCLASLPADTDGYVVEGVEGQEVRCLHCTSGSGGMKFKDGRWIAAWRND